MGPRSIQSTRLLTLKRRLPGGHWGGVMLRESASKIQGGTSEASG